MLAREKTLQAVILTIKNRYGKNAILKGSFLLDGAITAKRIVQIGGEIA